MHLTGTQTGTLASSTPLSDPRRIATSPTRERPRQRDCPGAKLTPAQFKAGYAPTDASAQSVESYLTQQAASRTSRARPRTTAVRERATALPRLRRGHSARRSRPGIVKRQGQGCLRATRPPPRVHVGAERRRALGPSGSTTPSPCTSPTRRSGCRTTSSPTTPQGFWKAYDAGLDADGLRARRSRSSARGRRRRRRLRPPHRGDSDESGQGARQRRLRPAPCSAGGRSGRVGHGHPVLDRDGRRRVAARHLQRPVARRTPTSTTVFNRFVTDDTAQAGSASFGECEVLPDLDGSMAAWDQIFQEAAAQGQTVFASAGDTGGFCPVEVGVNGVPAGAPDVNYPASSPWVVSAGGTTLLTNSDGSVRRRDRVARRWRRAEPVRAAAASGGTATVFSDPMRQVGPRRGDGRRPQQRVPSVYVDRRAAKASAARAFSSPLALGVWARARVGRTAGRRLRRTRCFSASAGIRRVPRHHPRRHRVRTRRRPRIRPGDGARHVRRVGDEQPHRRLRSSTCRGPATRVPDTHL